MKIAVIGKFYTEGTGLHIEETLLKMGHTVIRINPESEFVENNYLGERIKNITKTLYNQILLKISFFRKLKSKKIYRILTKEKVDLILSIHYILSKQ
jgi:hypothetical protein